jgi:hypothetical protein
LASPPSALSSGCEKKVSQTETETEKIETEFISSEIFEMKFCPEFPKTELTEKPKIETEFFGLTERPPYSHRVSLVVIFIARAFTALLSDSVGAVIA